MPETSDMTLAELLALEWEAGESIGRSRGVWPRGESDLPVCRIPHERVDGEAIAEALATLPGFVREARKLVALADRLGPDAEFAAGFWVAVGEFRELLARIDNA